MDRPRDQTVAGVSSAPLVGEFVWDVVLWRRGRGDVSACLLAATVSSWLLFFGSGLGYTLLSLASTVLLLLLTVLFLWAKAARLLNRPEPPIPEMRVSQEIVDQVAALLHSGLNTVFSTFHDIVLGKDSVLFYQVFLCLWIISIAGSLTDFPTFCYTSTVAVLTIPALYRKYEECIGRYMRFAYMNLQMYEMVYQRFSMKCLVKVRDWVIEVLKDP
ncbi:reticulon-like protein B12 isoform X1 [Phragmites australis]|uniref:reticulon-like protein B12 isoform X1 n=1 Tax=Phragmites australis TaxID=29695 RepID=UPI002D7993A0|nr:reticulon-like protein B12 isoform X1 [Phragmites australis]